ncbi:MAG: hypothetical protein SVO01_05525 [Thermotogota bacterium]|nr:hypothetical protein [Thermotogota bacterium]
MAVLMMVMLMSVSGLAASDTEIIEVYLNVPQFVRLSVASGDGQFDLDFDIDNPDAVISDTVELLAEANVDYEVTSSVTPVTDYEEWAGLLEITPNESSPFSGSEGNTVFDATATINVIDNLDLGALTTNTKIADVTFTISSL